MESDFLAAPGRASGVDRARGSPCKSKQPALPEGRLASPLRVRSS